MYAYINDQMVWTDRTKQRMRQGENPLEYSRRIVKRQSARVQREVAKQNAILRGEGPTKEESMADLALLNEWSGE